MSVLRLAQFRYKYNTLIKTKKYIFGQKPIFYIYYYMLVITKGEINRLILTLTEKVTIQEPKFLFQFKNDASAKSYFCIAPDLSLFPNRYNKFEITETDNPDNINAEIELPLTGFYHYFVYEQTSGSNLNPAGLNLVESGKLRVFGTPQELAAYSGQTNTRGVYNA